MLNYFGKIFAGGFFRTLGKIFAFILVGILIAFLASKFNLMQADAAFNYWANDVDLHGNILYWTGSNRLNFDSNTNDLKIYSPFYDDLDGTRINYSATTIVEGDTYLTSNATANVPYGIGVQYNFIKDQVYSLNYYVCFTNGYFDNWNTSSGGLNDVVNGSTDYTKYSYITRGSLLKLPYSSTPVGKYSECQLYSQAFVPTENIPWLGIWFMPKVNSQVDIFGFDIEMGGVYSEKNNDDLSNQITEMNTNITNQTNKIDNTIKDDNVDTGQAGGFFDSFDNTDHGGISGVITAPLSAINKINQPCSAININLWDKDISLPCGDTLFWNKENVSTFRGIWNLLVGGPIIYLLLVKLYHVIQSLKNPDDSRVEVAKL